MAIGIGDVVKQKEVADAPLLKVLDLGIDAGKSFASVGIAGDAKPSCIGSYRLDDLELAEKGKEPVKESTKLPEKPKEPVTAPK